MLKIVLVHGVSFYFHVQLTLVLLPGKLGCHLDRHENIGRGQLGLQTFSRIMNDETLDNIPLILETPPELTDREEIQMLYSLIKSQVSQHVIYDF